MHRRATGWILFAAVASAGCGRSASAPVYSLQASGGTYDDGSGRFGLAVLATARDARGAGPSGWDAVLLDGGVAVARASYDSAAVGSYAALVFPGFLPGPDRYALELHDGGVTLSTPVGAAAPAALTLPAPGLSLAGDRLDWSAIPGVSSYGCRVEGDAGLVLAAIGRDTGCPLDALPAGAYAISVLAYGADLLALAANPAQAPALPATFSVAEARLGLGVGSDGTPVVLRAAGGRIDYGFGVPGLALWLSITGPDGSATTDTWDLDIAGPGLPAGTPLVAAYPSSLPRVMLWAYTVPPDPGLYTVVGRSHTGVGVVRARFAVGEPAVLDSPTGLTADALAQGGVRVTWTAVPGAASTFASLYTRPTDVDPTSQYVAGQWVNGAEAQFPQGTVQAGVAYDAYATAANADLVNGGTPSQVSASENSYAPAGFVGR
jgi:hypothetical protein